MHGIEKFQIFLFIFGYNGDAVALSTQLLGNVLMDKYFTCENCRPEALITYEIRLANEKNG